MMVTVYARHAHEVSKIKRTERWAVQAVQMPSVATVGQARKEVSAKTRSWDIATKAARKLEQELELKANGIEPPKKPDYITIESAADLYLGDMDQRGIKDFSKARRMLSRLRDYANRKEHHLAQGCHRTTTNRMAEWLDISRKAATAPLSTGLL